jgi:tetratricopeptide (TPR) repeat protein
LSAAEREELSRRHAEHFLEMIRQSVPHMNGPEMTRWLDRLEAELGNLRAALDWTLAAGHSDAYLLAVTSLRPLWLGRYHIREGRTRLEQALATAPLSPLRASALTTAGMLANFDDDNGTALSLCEEGLALARELAPPVQIANALSACGHVANACNDFVLARTRLEECVQIFEQIGNRNGLCDALHSLGSVMMARDRAAARAYYERSLVLSESLGRRWRMALTRTQIGAILLYENDLQAARAHLQRALDLCKETGDPRHIEGARILMGMIYYREGDDARAEACFAESLENSRALSSRIYIGIAQLHLCDLRRRQGSLTEARRCCDEALMLLREIGNAGYVVQALESAASLAQAEGDFRRAAWLFGACDAVRETYQIPTTPYELVDLEPVVVAARDALGAARFTPLWNAGRKQTWQEAVPVALRERTVR